MGWYSYKSKYPKFGGAMPFMDGWGLFFLIVAAVIGLMALAGWVTMKLKGIPI